MWDLPAVLTDLEYLSLHEAGHLVAAHALDLDPAGSFIATDGRMAGGTVVDLFAGTAFEQAVVALAGLAATRIAGDRSTHFLSEAGDDLERAEAYLADLEPARRREVGPTVFKVLRDHWKLVLAVSAALAVSGEVGREELARLAGGPQTAVQGPQTGVLKILARTEMESVYVREVRADEPVAWWRLGDPATITTGLDQIGSRDLTFADNPRSGEALVTNDPQQSTFFDHAEEGSGNVAEATVTTPIPSYPFTIETVFRSAKQSDTLARFLLTIAGNNDGGGDATRVLQLSLVATFDGELTLEITDDQFATGSSFGTFNLRLDDKSIHHAVIVCTASDDADIWIDGVQVADAGTFTAGVDLPSGTVQLALGNVTSNYPTAGEFGLDGELQDVAIYDKALSAARIAVHADAALAPWQGDDPSERLARILDIAEWPDGLRELNAGSTTFQSAETANQTALEHAQKVGETEFGLFFADRAGNVVLRDQAWQAARTTYPIVFGDGPGEVGYRSIRPDDGDEVIRNSATISRLNGVAQTATGTTIDEFGRFQYTLDGLLHDTDAWSAAYATFITDEYGSPRRRVTEITVGPPPDGEEDLYYPAMLGLELGDTISLSFTPSGLGDPWTQTAVVEGIRHSSASGRNRQVTFTLSPEFSETLFGI